MTRPLLLGLIAPAMLLSGCNAYRGLESANQPVVQRADYAMDLSTSGNGLAPGEDLRLAGWMQSLRTQYGDRVHLDDPSASPGVRAAVAAQAGRYGLSLSDAAPVTPGEIAPGTARVVISRYSASVPSCPNFSGVDQPNYDGHTTPNYGCAVNTNLAAMVARPEDLVRGQPGAAVSDPAVATKAITTYRTAQPSGSGGLKSESTGNK